MQGVRSLAQEPGSLRGDIPNLRADPLALRRRTNGQGGSGGGGRDWSRASDRGGGGRRGGGGGGSGPRAGPRAGRGCGGGGGGTERGPVPLSMRFRLEAGRVRMVARGRPEHVLRDGRALSPGGGAGRGGGVLGGLGRLRAGGEGGGRGPRGGRVRRARGTCLGLRLLCARKGMQGSV